MASNTTTPRGYSIPLLLASVIVVQAAVAGPHDAGEQPFMEENRVAMARMMAGMHIAATGDVDRDFATMMIPHHQGAIDMARAELRHGTDPQLRRIAQGIVVEQQQEIEAMRLSLGDHPQPSASRNEAHR